MAPVAKAAKLQGELRVSVARFKARGPVVMLGMRVEDVQGNFTDVYLPPNKNRALYDVKQSGKDKYEIGPILEWIMLKETK